MKKMLLRGVGCAAVFFLGSMLTEVNVSADELQGWVEEGGNYYWYEDGVKQGTVDRGKEIYDPISDAWYWLDSVDGGKKAVSKDVYQESLAGAWGEVIGEDGLRYGKWVRYDAEGHMVKGWDVSAEGTYYFDVTYGTMAKGEVTIDGVQYVFDTVTGKMSTCSISMEPHWEMIDGVEYWYEGGVRQGYNPADPTYRGKEIFDSKSNCWYWLDNTLLGAKAKNKDVYQESAAGDWAENEDGTGKWVRYCADGNMAKGWGYSLSDRYYFDPTYGTMAKGFVTIEDREYLFDTATGIYVGELVTNQDGNVEIVLQENKAVKYSGEFGDVFWAITAEGKLVIVGTCGEEQADGWQDAPWLAYKTEIKSVYANLKKAVNLSGLFSNLEYAEYIDDLGLLETSQVTDMSSMFDGFGGYKTVKSNIDLRGLDTSNVTDMSNMFYGARSAQLDLSSFDTSNVTDMSNMFNGLHDATVLDLSGFDTSNVTNMSGMFQGNKDYYFGDLYSTDLETIDLSSFDTSNVTDMSGMFQECNSLETLDLSSFDTGNVVTMERMFYATEGRLIDVDGFDTGNVVNMKEMFAGKYNGFGYTGASLENVDLTHFDTSKVQTMEKMFMGRAKVESLDLRSFNMREITTASSMFANCVELKEIFVGQDWVLSPDANVENMYGNDSSIKVTIVE